MSNELINAHIALGEPCGEDADFSQIADWAGNLISSYNGTMNKSQMSWLREIGEYLHVEEYNEGSRKDALESYFRLYDSITGRD